MIGFERETKLDGGNKDEIRKLSLKRGALPSCPVHGHDHGTHKTDLQRTITGLRVSVNFFHFLFISTYETHYLGQSRLEKKKIQICNEK